MYRQDRACRRVHLGKNQELARPLALTSSVFEDLRHSEAGQINFDRVIASPDAMRVVGQLGQISARAA